MGQLSRRDSSSEPAGSKRRRLFLQHFKQRFHLRLHMTLILGGVLLSSVVVSKLLLELGIRSMLVRYPVVVAVSYSLFLVFIRLWLMLLRQQMPHSSSGKEVDLDIGDLLDAVCDAPSGIGAPVHARTLPAGISHSGGIGHVGSHGGGGSTSSANWIGSMWDGIDLDGEGILVLMAFALLLVLIFGAVIYLIYQAPAILSEAAFETILASGLVKAANRVRRAGWAGKVCKATMIPFVAVLLMSIIFGAVVARYRPEAVKLTDVLHHKSERNR